MKLRYTAAWVGCTAAALLVTYAAGMVPAGEDPAEADVPGVSAELMPDGAGAEAAPPLPLSTAAAG
ncbi:MULTISPECIES: hypothetical protein [Streptomyces]|uniref:Uncharacterized protein n=1 Tax=Streptomyces chilikensis TaxID=1194079 RepID=A0ABV3ERC5_9ACTN|nr:MULTISPECIES: hypothetical protein [Streptomyces]MDH6226909.1 hypothetical protein [Streptomyces sp. MJP52]